MAAPRNSRQIRRDLVSVAGGDMEYLRRVAFETVLRACGFGSLAIFCVMIGLSFEPRAAFKAGGMLTLLMTAILMLKAYEARTKNHRKTEMWLYVPEEMRPPEAYAQKACSAVLQETYLTFARWSAAIAVVMGVLALVFSLAGK
jgi:predicted membrane metal-binding protein